MNYGYARVSTIKQGHGNSLEEQLTQLFAAGCDQVIEEKFSGKDNTPSSKLIRNIFLSFAEFERDMILERTREGKEIARTKEGYKEGRPKKFTKDQIDLALSMLSVNGGDKSYNEVEKLIGISVSTLKRENNKRKLEKLNN